MSVDNLPCELPRDTSEDFGNQLIKNVIPHLVGNDHQGIIKGATITENTQLTQATLIFNLLLWANSLFFNLHNHLNFNGDATWQCTHSHSSSGMFTFIAKNCHHQV